MREDTLTDNAMARLTKWEIAQKIEALPGNTPWGVNSMMSHLCDDFTRQELVDRYNGLIEQRGLGLEKIE